MAKKRNIKQDIKDIIEQGIGSVKSALSFLRETSHDKRTIKTTQAAARELSKEQTPTQIAESLGISHQKWTAVKRGIEKGQVYSPELRDILREKEQSFENEPQQLDSGAWYFPAEGKLKQVNHVDRIKSFPFLEDAEEWLATIINSNTFIGITSSQKNGQKFYHVVGFGRRSQRPKNGKILERGGRNRVGQLLKQYGKG